MRAPVLLLGLALLCCHTARAAPKRRAARQRARPQAGPSKVCLGVDLGSETARAAVSGQYGRGSRVVLNSLSGRAFPLVVGWRTSEEDGSPERVVSEGAKHLLEGRPAATVQRARAAVVEGPVRPIDVAFAGGSVRTTAVETLATLFDHMYKAAGGGSEVQKDIAVALPSHVSSADRRIIAASVEAAGLNPPVIFNEHYALAVAYSAVHEWNQAQHSSGSSSSPKKAAVVMFVSASATSVQATVVRYTLVKGSQESGGRLMMQKTAHVMSHAQTSRIGSKWVQLHTLQHVLGSLLGNATLCPTEASCDSIRTMRDAAEAERATLFSNSTEAGQASSVTDRAMARALHLTKKAVEELTSRGEAELRFDHVFDGVPGIVSYSITRPEFEALNDVFATSVVDVVRQAARLYDANHPDTKPLLSRRSERLNVPHGIELYGGAARMPYVTTALTQLLGPHSGPLYHRLDKDEATAIATAVTSANFSYPDPSSTRVTDLLTPLYLVEVFALSKGRRGSDADDTGSRVASQKHRTKLLLDSPIFAKYIGGGGVTTDEETLFNTSYPLCPAGGDADTACQRGPHRPPGLLYVEAGPAYQNGKTSGNKYPQTRVGGGHNFLPLRLEVPVVANLQAALGKGSRDGASVKDLDALLVTVTAVGNDAARPSGGERVEAAFLVEDIQDTLRDVVSDGTKQGLKPGMPPPSAPQSKKASRHPDPFADPLELLVRITAAGNGVLDVSRVKLSQAMHKKAPAAKAPKKGSGGKRAPAAETKYITERLEKRVPVTPLELADLQKMAAKLRLRSGSQARSGSVSDIDVDDVHERLQRMNLADDRRHELASARNDLEGLVYEAREVVNESPGTDDAAILALKEEVTSITEFLEAGRHPLTEYHLHRVKVAKMLDVLRAVEEPKAVEEECNESASDAGAEAGAEGGGTGELSIEDELAAQLGEEAGSGYVPVEEGAGSFWFFLCRHTKDLHHPTPHTRHSDIITYLKEQLRDARRRCG